MSRWTELAGALKVSTLKSQARRAYETHRAEVGRYDCGRALAAVVNPRVSQAAAEFNAAMRELEVLDPTCPKWEPL